MKSLLYGKIIQTADSSLRGHTLSYGSAIIAERFLSFLIIPLLTKTLSQELYGVWTQIIVTTGLVCPLVLFGFPKTMVRFLAGNKNGSEESGIFHGMVAIVLVNLFIVAIVILFFDEFLSKTVFGDAGFSDFIYLLGFFLAVEALFELSIHFLRSHEQIRVLSMYYFLKNGGRVAILAAGILLFEFNLSRTIAIVIIMQLLLSLHIYVKNIFHKIGFSISMSRVLWKSMLCYSAPLIPYGILIWFNNFVDRYFILHFLNIKQVSIYAVSFSLAGIAGLFYGVLGFTLYPHMARLWNEGNRRGTGEILAKAIKYYLFFIFLFVAILSIFGTPLIRIIATSEYVSSWNVMFWLASGVGAYGLYELHVYALLVVDRTVVNLNIAVVGLVVNVVLNFILVPMFGILGAAVATVVSNSIMAIIAIVIGRKSVRYNFPWRVTARIGLATFVMCLVAWMCIRNVGLSGLFGLLFGIVLAVVIYGAIDMLSRDSIIAELMRNR
jgi:O-antigen/teichoic acid export membrane protein